MTLDGTLKASRRDLESLLSLGLSARVLDVGQPFEPSLPTRPSILPFKSGLVLRHGDAVLPDGTTGAFEMLSLSTHTGTHIDALSHVAHEGKLFGGIDAEEAQRGGRFKDLGIETLAPLVYHGVLLDVAGAFAVSALPAGQAITAGDLEQTREAQSLTMPASAAVFIRTGWGAAEIYRSSAYLGIGTPLPGPDESGADWLVEQNVRVTGSDTMAFECTPQSPGLPVHRRLLVEAGIYIIENLNLEQLSEDHIWEFLLVVAPLNLVGATGAPLRPLALVPS